MEQEISVIIIITPQITEVNRTYIAATKIAMINMIPMKIPKITTHGSVGSFGGGSRDSLGVAGVGV
jgi:hypothetical protein